jgi:hypothetical protein
VLKNVKSIVFEDDFTEKKTDMSARFTSKDKEYWGAFYINV